jgi:hypothetical protein
MLVLMTAVAMALRPTYEHGSPGSSHPGATADPRGAGIERAEGVGWTVSIR